MAKNAPKDNPLNTRTDELMRDVDTADSTDRDKECYAYMRLANSGQAEFHGNPWHAFPRLMSEYLAGIPKPDREAGLPIHDGSNNYRLSWQDITDISLARRNVTQVEVNALAGWIGLGSHADEFMKSGEHFIADREELKALRGLEQKEPRSKPAETSAAKPSRPKIHTPERPAKRTSASPDLMASPKAVAEPSTPLASFSEQHTPAPPPSALLLTYFQKAGLSAEDVATRIETKLPGHHVLPQLRGTVGSIEDTVLIELLNILNLEQHDAHALMDANMAARTSAVRRA